MSLKKDYALTFVELRSVREIRNWPIYQLSHLWITNKRPAVASEKQNFLQSNKLVKKDAVSWVHTAAYPW